MIVVNKTVVEVAQTNEIIFDEPLEYVARQKIDWLDHEFVEKEKQRSGPGEFGVPVILDKDEAERSKNITEEYSYNVVVSDRISLDRAIPDTRAPR